MYSLLFASFSGDVLARSSGSSWFGGATKLNTAVAGDPEPVGIDTAADCKARDVVVGIGIRCGGGSGQGFVLRHVERIVACNAW